MDETQLTTTRCGYAALIGAPNSGKSTLLNRLVGRKLFREVATAVGRSVIDDDHVHVDAGLIERAADGLIKEPAVVVAGDHDRDARRGLLRVQRPRLEEGAHSPHRYQVCQRNRLRSARAWARALRRTFGAPERRTCSASHARLCRIDGSIARASDWYSRTEI